VEVLYKCECVMGDALCFLRVLGPSCFYRYLQGYFDGFFFPEVLSLCRSHVCFSVENRGKGLS
jgi:hypothetical protein